ncbi:DUF7931 domain-containing protein [Thiomonas sp.]|uniref:DUF7931 domain-containing protein n=1 Tax=mine drainage metagenome TaxID=410659 RepID=E6PPX5_9ZZZZ
MTSAAQSTNSAATAISGLSAWQQAIAELLSAPGQTFSMYSTDYADWPLNQLELVNALDAWGLQRKHPSIRMLARRFDIVQRDQARFTQWRVRFSHLIDCRELPEDLAAPAECLLMPERGLVAIPSDGHRRASQCSGGRLHAAFERFDQAWALSDPGFPAHVLGL